MAANTKYQQAPQRDSFEEANYTQAPPSYQAEPSYGTPHGQPRGEDDNVPDDFKVYLASSSPHCLISFVICLQDIVRWFGRRGHFADQDAIHPQGVLDTVSGLIYAPLGRR